MNKTATVAVLASVLAAATPASAADVLYRVDFSIGTDFMAQALAGSGHTVTTVSGNLGGVDLSAFDLVVYANQNSFVPGGDTGRLNSYIGTGGKVIFTDWTRSAGTLPLLNSAFTGGGNQTSLTVGGLFSSGIMNPLTVANTGWGTFSTGLASVGGTVAGTFGNGEAAIVVGNGGRTIHNGFLTDTVASSQLYGNQIGYLLGMSAAVPEPSTWALMLLGFFGLGAAVRRQNRQNVTVSYA